MRVTDAAGREAEAIPMARHGGSREFWLVKGLLLDRRELHHLYVPQPERRTSERRATRRGTPRRLLDVLTEREIVALARGPEHTV
jgi:hypothetical protein